MASPAPPQSIWEPSPVRVVSRPKGVVMRDNNNPDKDSKGARRRRQRGAALVETALVLITLLGMILFILDMGRILLTEQFIAERARVGARNAVVNNWNSTDVANYVNDTTTTAPSGNPPGFLGLLTSQVTLTP